MHYKELYKIISKPWLDIKDIMAVAQCGRKSATRIRIDIENNILKEGKKLPLFNKKLIPTTKLLEYLGMDENYIYDMARRENIYEETKMEWN